MIEVGSKYKDKISGDIVTISDKGSDYWGHMSCVIYEKNKETKWFYDEIFLRSFDLYENAAFTNKVSKCTCGVETIIPGAHLDFHSSWCDLKR